MTQVQKPKPEWVDGVVPGDWLIPDPLWNSTSRPPDQLSSPTKVHLVDRTKPCEWGALVLVETKNGAERWLSAGWFLGPYNPPEMMGS